MIVRKISDACGVALAFIFSIAVLAPFYWLPIWAKLFFPHQETREQMQNLFASDPDRYFLLFTGFYAGTLIILVLGFRYLGGLRRFGLALAKTAPNEPQWISKKRTAEPDSDANAENLPGDERTR